MDIWSVIIAVVALLFSITCFYLFVVNALPKPVPDKVVEDAEARARSRGLDPATIGALAKALAEAFSKVGPSALALIGAILFLLLAGQAAGVYDLTDAPGNKPQSSSRTKGGTGGEGNQSAGSTTRNESGEAANQTGNAQ